MGGLAGSLYACAFVEAGAALGGSVLLIAMTGMMVGYTVGGAVGPGIGGLGIAMHDGIGLFVALAVPLAISAVWLAQLRKRVLRASATIDFSYRS